MKQSRWVVTYMESGVRQFAYFDTKEQAYKGITRVADKGGTNIHVGKVNMVEKVVVNRRTVFWLLAAIGTILWAIVFWQIKHYWF